MGGEADVRGRQMSDHGERRVEMTTDRRRRRRDHISIARPRRQRWTEAEVTTSAVIAIVFSSHHSLVISETSVFRLLWRLEIWHYSHLLLQRRATGRRPCSSRPISPACRANSSKPAARCCQLSQLSTTGSIAGTDGRTPCRYIDLAAYYATSVNNFDGLSDVTSRTERKSIKSSLLK